MSNERNAAPLRHALTIDVEDWYHVENMTPLYPPERWADLEPRLEESMARLLDLFDEKGVKATCFVLGKAAERHPDVVKQIVRRGHELACHGWSHELVYRQTPDVFRAETRQAKAFLEDLTGVPVLGYRASTFSIVDRSLWALDILREEGFLYDSSIAPLHHDRYGIPDAPREPHIRNGLQEFPVSTLHALGGTFPLGGGFFRLFPLRWTTRALRRHEAAGRPAMLYLHPWEIDPGQPRVKGLKLANRLRHYARLGATYGKLARLLDAHRWGTMRELLRARLPVPA